MVWTIQQILWDFVVCGAMYWVVFFSVKYHDFFIAGSIRSGRMQDDDTVWWIGGCNFRSWFLNELKFILNNCCVFCFCLIIRCDCVLRFAGRCSSCNVDPTVTTPNYFPTSHCSNAIQKSKFNVPQHSQARLNAISRPIDVSIQSLRVPWHHPSLTYNWLFSAPGLALV